MSDTPPGEMYDRFVRVRNGTPHLAQKLKARVPVRVVAFGSSMTHGGYYLSSLAATLAEHYGSDVQVEGFGFRGASCNTAAFNVDRITRHAPDLVLIEFSINDCLRPGNHFFEIPDAVSALITRVLAVSPECDFLFVHFEHFENGEYSRKAIAINEAVADYLATPSINLGTFTHAMISNGTERLTGEGGLTSDGTHHTPRASTAIGIPFAEMVLSVLSAQDSVRPGLALELPPSRLERAHSVPIRELPHNDGWRFLPPDDTLAMSRGRTAFEHELSQCVAAPATIDFTLRGNCLIISPYSSMSGSLVISIGGSEREISIDGSGSPSFAGIRTDVPEGEYACSIRANTTGMYFGDVAFIGELAEWPKR